MKNTVLIAISLYCGAAQAAPQYKAFTLPPPILSKQVIDLRVNCRGSESFFAGSITYIETGTSGSRNNVVLWHNNVPEILPPAEPNNLHNICLAAYPDGSVLTRDFWNGKCYWYKDGIYKSIDSIRGDTYVQQANNNRQFALLLNSTTFQDRAALWQNDVITPLNGIGLKSRAYGILEDGTVIGDAEKSNHFGAACIWKPGSLDPTLLNVPGMGSQVQRGTSNGYYFGLRTDDGLNDTPFLYKDGITTDLVEPQWYGDGPYLIGVDTSGRAIISTLSSIYGIQDTLWDHGVPYKFTDLILDSEVANNYPTLRSMSEDGTLFGGYQDKDYQWHGLVFTPVPEPASLAILGIGVLAVLRRRRNIGSC